MVYSLSNLGYTGTSLGSMAAYSSIPPITISPWIWVPGLILMGVVIGYKLWKK